MNQEAVLGGINLYKNYPEAELRGCVNDLNNLYTHLHQTMDWVGLGIVTLIDLQAAASNIKGTVLDMVRRAKAGDHVVWTHSSHGSNNPDPSQRDGMQELLCCYDLKEVNGLYTEDTCITAKWIGGMIKELHPKATMDILLDSCHDPEGDQLKGLAMTYSRVRWMPRSIVGPPVKPKLIQQVRSTIPPNVALWSACEPAQTSAEAYVDNMFQGAFTAAWLKSWQAGRTRADMITMARKWLKENRYNQVPHLYCSQELAQRPFGE